MPYRLHNLSSNNPKSAAVAPSVQIPKIGASKEIKICKHFQKINIESNSIFIVTQIRRKQFFGALSAKVIFNNKRFVQIEELGNWIRVEVKCHVVGKERAIRRRCWHFVGRN